MSDETSTIDTISFERLPEKRVSGPRLLFGYLGLFLLFVGGMNALPLLTLTVYHGNAYAWWYFLLPAALSAGLGAGLYFGLLYRKPQGRLSKVENMTLLLLVWLLAIFVSGIPYWLWGRFGGMNAVKDVVVDADGLSHVVSAFEPGGKSHAYYYFSQAMYESTSGFSSSGLTLLPTVTLPEGTYSYNLGLFRYATEAYSEFVPNVEIFFFHRALMSFTGGIGLVLILASAMNSRSGFQLYLLEGHNDRLLPNLLQSARMIFGMYCVYILLGVLLLCLEGVTFFDALCYSMAAVSTGGFGTHATSVAFFTRALGTTRGILVELTVTLLMILGMISFIVHYFVLTRKFRKAFRHYEFYVFLTIFVLFYPMMVYGLYQKYQNVGDAFRFGLFEFFSYLSTSGFSSVDSYLPVVDAQLYGPNVLGSIPAPAFFAMIILPILGGFTGSTSGGLKMNRVGDLFLGLHWSLKDAVERKEVITTHYTEKYGEKVPTDKDDLTDAFTYLVLYLSTIFLLASVLMLTGYDPQLSIFEVSSALAGLGESVGIGLSASLSGQFWVLWVQIIAMFLGRLEIRIVIYFFKDLTRSGRNFRNIYVRR